MQSLQGYSYATAVKHASNGGGLTMHAPQRLISAEMPDFSAKAQVTQRLTGWAKRVTQGSQTMPLLGQALQTAHWLGIQFKRRCRKGVFEGRSKRLNIECQYTRSNTWSHTRSDEIIHLQGV